MIPELHLYFSFLFFFFLSFNDTMFINLLKILT